MADVATRPQERSIRRKPFASFVKRLTHFKSSTDSDKAAANKKQNAQGTSNSKGRKYNTINFGKNNPYPLSGDLRPQFQASHPSIDPSLMQEQRNSSFGSLPHNDREGPSHSNKSGAPTLATNPETIHSDAGHSKAATATTAGVLSSVDGAGHGSTFSSPNPSEHSLATTLTTVQSSSQLGQPSGGVSSHNHQSQPLGSTFSHQYPVSPGPSTVPASAIPRHVYSESHAPNTYNSATANNLLTDNASILTLASSSKRRRRSMDTDHASVRALAPSSVWGGSRESLPISVLSGNAGATAPTAGLGSASAERASVYSSSGLIRDRDSTAPALTSERNSYYGKQPGDAKSLRSITTNFKDDARSQYDARSINNMDARSINDVASLRSSHARNDSTAGLATGSPLVTPTVARQLSSAGYGPSLSRRSSDRRVGDDSIEAKDTSTDVQA